MVNFVDSGLLHSPKEASAAIQRLVAELDTLTLVEVSRLLEAVMAGLKTRGGGGGNGSGNGSGSGGGDERQYDGACLALVPKLLMRIAQGSFVNDDKILTSGADFKEKILEQFYLVEWPEHIGVRIVTVLREIPMSKKFVLELTEKALDMLPSLPVQDLPAYVYQSLLFASTKPAKVLAINKIMDHFDGFKCPQRGANNQGTVQLSAKDRELLHVQVRFLVVVSNLLVAGGVYWMSAVFILLEDTLF